MSITATDVFVPGSYPAHTYVERDSGSAEAALRSALSVKGQIVSIAGPSKSGKTVLIEKVVGIDNLIAIPGNAIKTPDDLWSRVLDWMAAPTTIARSKSSTTTFEGKGKIGGEIGHSLIAKGKANAEASVSWAGDSGETITHVRNGLLQVLDDLAESDYVLLIDDFHYMPTDTQVEIAKALKEATRAGLKIITARAPHKSDVVLRANSELRGRIRTMDLGYWSGGELQKIAEIVFATLNASLPANVIENFVIESAGSPLLMQLLCLEACLILGIKDRNSLFVRNIQVSQQQSTLIFAQTSDSTNFKSLVQKLDDGARPRGQPRNTFKFRDGTVGDVYRAVLKAVAADPPALILKYDELIERIKAITKDAAATGSSVVKSCEQISKIAQDTGEQLIEWDADQSILAITDPLLLFYLRWAKHLKQ